MTITPATSAAASMIVATTARPLTLRASSERERLERICIPQRLIAVKGHRRRFRHLPFAPHERSTAHWLSMIFGHTPDTTNARCSGHVRIQEAFLAGAMRFLPFARLEPRVYTPAMPLGG